VRPGMTGLAQVMGRNEASWDERLAWDVEYVRNLTLFLDLKIMARTVVKVLKREHVAVLPMNAMKDFDEERKNAGKN